MLRIRNSAPRARRRGACRMHPHQRHDRLELPPNRVEDLQDLLVQGVVDRKAPEHPPERVDRSPRALRQKRSRGRSARRTSTPRGTRRRSRSPRQPRSPWRNPTGRPSTEPRFSPSCGRDVACAGARGVDDLRGQARRARARARKARTGRGQEVARARSEEKPTIACPRPRSTHRKQVFPALVEMRLLQVQRRVERVARRPPSRGPTCAGSASRRVAE